MTMKSWRETDGHCRMRWNNDVIVIENRY